MLNEDKKSDNQHFSTKPTGSFFTKVNEEESYLVLKFKQV